jgi:hypothetical protein
MSEEAASKDIVETGEASPVLHVMNEQEARDITESIQSTAVATCVLLQRAHDQQAWKALGYKTWAEYIDNEFKFSRARSYQLLSQGSVIQEISEASDADVYLTEKEAKAIKKELPRITEKVKEATKDIEDKDERKAAAKNVVEDEVEKTTKADNKKFEDDEDAEELTQDEWRPQGGNAAAANPDLAEKHQKDEAEKQTSFYLENLNRTLAIVQAMPSAESIADAETMADDEKIKLRNDLKYAIKWMSDLVDNLD